MKLHVIFDVADVKMSYFKRELDDTVGNYQILSRGTLPDDSLSPP